MNSMGDRDILISVRDLSYYYPSDRDEDQSEALRGVSIDIKRGEFLAVIGHNGSGKSTLAKHLNGLLLPTEGEVVVDGMNTRDKEMRWEIRRRVGMVFQNPDNQIIATSVAEDVAFGLENLGVEPAEIRRRVEDALKVVGMLPYMGREPHLLSGGQKQRVAIAGILAIEPECIVLDEPTAMLDPVGRGEVMKTILELNREHSKTVVHITHFMEEAVMADRIIVMENGRIVLEGSPVEIFSDIDRLRRLHLDVPAVTELAVRLRRRGVDIREDIISIDDIVDALARLL